MKRTLSSLLGILAVVAVASASPDLKVLKDGTQHLGSEILAIKDPVDKTAMAVLSKRCEAVKKVFGQGYRQVSTPDFSKLTLKYLTREVSISYNLSSAGELLPTSRWFHSQDKIIIYMHGFIDSPTRFSYKDMNEAFLNKGYNVVALDSSSLLGVSTLYIGATTNVRYIGEQLGAILANMVKVGTDPSSIYLIGHSLGAHIAGFTGKTFRELTGQLVGRITGLDPAGPCFTAVDDDLKLKSTDAQFVDVIHTDDGVFGLKESRGHVDYYVNSGSLQPKCVSQTCSHNRAWLLYTETVQNPEAMPAVQCDSWDQFKKGQCNTSDVTFMGYNCPPSTRGKYYLQTGGTAPFGLGLKGISYVNTDGLVKGIGSALGVSKE